ncbi:DUF910 family protein [Filobacillus milosensis]|uniref:DUF910 family protein n=1 Tax=Filobacillus milosensis TaxID=94137 RepID=A0A4Y8ISB3_9BACI|nr:YqgQ family protein [Filobacillus milosensis]TFB23803.1 DUF910 family protein [Filobacillus milosensis]
METMIDVRQLLKRFGVFVYVGNKKADLHLMEDEINALFDNGLITREDYMSARLIIKKEKKDLE